MLKRKIYLQQFLSQVGLASRRQAIELIKSNQVKVNNKIAHIGIKINPAKDQIKINNKLIQPVKSLVYYLVNKPIGYTCTVSDRYAEHKVVDLVPATPKVWPVGRLDKDSHGLILLTNDGDFTNKITHPKFEHAKQYVATLNKDIHNDLLSQLKHGIKLKEGLAKVDQIKQLASNKILITIHQGWNRQLRRMLGALNYKIVDLKRVQVGKWKLGNLEEGTYKQIKI